MAKLTTKVSEGTKKVLEPGEVKATIRDIKLDPSRFKEGGYNIVLLLEGDDLGKDFQGFFIDKIDESKGRYKGQIGNVRTSEWPYADGETKSGVKISRDAEIVKFLTKLCRELDTDWLEKQDDKHDTIEQLVDALNIDKPYKDIELVFCLAGREYKNGKDYINYDLYLPKFSKFASPFTQVENSAKLVKFSEELHIKKIKVTEKFDTTDEDMPVDDSFEL